MKEFLKFSIAQTNILWNDKISNLERYKVILDNFNDTDIVIFPELFDTGFVTDVNILNIEQNNLTKNWLLNEAVARGFSIGATSIFNENNKFFNRFFFVNPDGTLDYYDKKHLFSIAGEDEFISYGNKRTIVKKDNWRINLLVCYDLRFPVWARNKNDYHILIYPANWPDSRIEQWKALLVARAIENQAYVVGVNRIGIDFHGFKYPGKSLIISPKGEIIYEAKVNEEDLFTTTFDFNYLTSLRKKFPVLNDADKFELK